MLLKILRESFITAFGLILVSTFLASLAKASPLDLTLGPATTATGLALGSVCYAIDASDEALPCNPAFTAKETRPDFRADLFFGNDVSYMQDVSALLAGEGNEETVRRLFSKAHASEMEANTEAAYRRPTFGIAITPYRIIYSSMTRDQALPVVSLLAAREQSMRMQFAGYLGNEWSWGLQIRGVQRVFISRTFSLTDALAEGGNVLLLPETQNAFYLEPGLMREWLDSDWKPQLTMAITQLGTVDHKNEDFPASPEFNIGGAVTAPIEIGRWQLGLNASFSSRTQTWLDPLRFGSVYDVGMTRLAGSFGRSDQAFGFLIRYWAMTGGLTYRSRYIVNWLGDAEWVRSIAFQFGVDF